MNLREKLLVALFAALICISSTIALPIGPVPITLQILFILLSGAVLGARGGGASVLLWVALGVAGLPVFAGGKAGFAVLLGPTGGYILGFVLSACFVGWMAGPDRMPTFRKLLAAMVIGIAIIHIVGLAGFMTSFALFLQKPMTLSKALGLATLPFLPIDFAKALAAAAIAPNLQRALRHIHIQSRPE